MYQERFYRNLVKTNNLTRFNVTEGESDLEIFSKGNLKDLAGAQLSKYRGEITAYISKQRNFLTSLTPVKPIHDAPEIIQHMCSVAKTAGVGPMAAVAGAISEYVGKALEPYTDEIIIENGGDIYMKNKTDKSVLVYAGDSPFSNKIAVLISGGQKPVGICTSSGTFGHSLSFGKADAVMIVSKDTLLADGVATAICNKVQDVDDMKPSLDKAKSIPGVDGVLIILRDRLAVWGNINLINP